MTSFPTYAEAEAHGKANAKMAYDVEMGLWGDWVVRMDHETYSQRTTPTGCQHVWSYYQGFRETYDYCETCDVKKPHNYPEARK